MLRLASPFVAVVLCVGMASMANMMNPQMMESAMKMFQSMDEGSLKQVRNKCAWQGGCAACSRPGSCLPLAAQADADVASMV